MPSYGGFLGTSGGTGITAAQAAKVAGLGVDGYPLLATIDTDEVTDGIPHGWQALGPLSASGLTISTAITTASAKVCTLITDRADQWRNGQITPGGIGFRRAHGSTVFTAEVSISGVDFSNMSASKFVQFSIGECIGSGKTGSYALARFFHDVSGSPKWLLAKTHKLANDTGHTNSTHTLSASDPVASASFRYVAARDGFQVYVDDGGWTEVGSGAIDWLAGSTVATTGDIHCAMFDSPRYFICELSCTETFGTPANGPTVTIDSLTFSGVE